MKYRIEVTLGIDIGGTNTVFGFVGKEGNCYAEFSINTNANEPAEKLVSRIHAVIKSSYLDMHEKFLLKGIGICAPNANYYKGTVEYPSNLNWGLVNIVALVKEYFNLPVVLTNDANAAAIGEMKFGAAKGMKDFIVITLGTGVGSAIVANGELIYGADGFAGEIGHTIYDRNGRECGCGRKGCLETYTSAVGIRKTVLELLRDSNTESELRKIAQKDITSKTIYDTAMRGDKIALEAFDYTGKVLGTVLADSVAYTSPEAIILFGGLAMADHLLIEPTKRYMEENILGNFKNKVKILKSGLPKVNSAVLGASALIWNELAKMPIESCAHLHLTD